MTERGLELWRCLQMLRLSRVHGAVISEERLGARLVAIQLVKCMVAISTTLRRVDGRRWVRVPWRNISIDIDWLVNPHLSNNFLGMLQERTLVGFTLTELGDLLAIVLRGGDVRMDVRVSWVDAVLTIRCLLLILVIVLHLCQGTDTIGRGSRVATGATTATMACRPLSEGHSLTKRAHCLLVLMVMLVVGVPTSHAVAIGPFRDKTVLNSELLGHVDLRPITEGDRSKGRILSVKVPRRVQDLIV